MYYMYFASHLQKIGSETQNLGRRVFPYTPLFAFLRTHRDRVRPLVFWWYFSFHVVEQSTLVSICKAHSGVFTEKCFLGQPPILFTTLAVSCTASTSQPIKRTVEKSRAEQQQSTLVSWGRAKSPDRDFRAAPGSCCNAQPPNLHTLTFPPPCLAAAQCTCPDPLFFNKVVEIWLFSMKTNTFVRQSRTHLLKWLLNLHKPVTCLINYTKVLPLWRKWKSQQKHTNYSQKSLTFDLTDKSYHGHWSNLK